MASQVLPLDDVNINLLNIRLAVFAAVKAFDSQVDKADLASCSSLVLASQKGASEQQLLSFGKNKATVST
jgi:hypothetical protein